jgi:hypothetical protein
MTNRFLISVAVLALVAGTGFANAQGTGGRESGAQMQNAPSAGGGAATESRESSKSSPGMKAEQKSPTAGQNQRAEENAPGQKSKSMSSENESKGGQKNMKAEGREDRNANKAAETKQPGRENEKNAQTQGRETEKNAQTQGTKENMNAQTRTQSNTTVGQAGAGAKMSSDQRTKITTIIRNEHVAPVNNIDFTISVGTRVPHERISLRPLPAEVITVYPEWRGYEFFLVRDEIIVVDPNTFEIVAVLNA